MSVLTSRIVQRNPTFPLESAVLSAHTRLRRRRYVRGRWTLWDPQAVGATQAEAETLAGTVNLAHLELRAAQVCRGHLAPPDPSPTSSLSSTRYNSLREERKDRAPTHSRTCRPRLDPLGHEDPLVCVDPLDHKASWVHRVTMEIRDHPDHLDPSVNVD